MSYGINQALLLAPRRRFDAFGEIEAPAPSSEFAPSSRSSRAPSVRPGVPSRAAVSAPLAPPAPLKKSYGKYVAHEDALSELEVGYFPGETPTSDGDREKSNAPTKLAREIRGFVVYDRTMNDEMIPPTAMERNERIVIEGDVLAAAQTEEDLDIMATESARMRIEGKDIVDVIMDVEMYNEYVIVSFYPNAHTDPRM
jgi:hypothetical protein